MMKSMQCKEKEPSGGTMPEMEQPKYPYGLSISLNDESIEILGIDKLPEVGSVLTIMAHVKVTGVSSQEVLKDDDSTPERRIDMQITDMELVPQSNDKDFAKALYGEDQKA